MRSLKEHKNIFLLKLFSVNSIGVLLRSLLGLVSQKLIAIYLGPNGLALVGNLRNALALFGLGSTVGIDQGVLKYQSQFKNDDVELKKLYATSLAYSIVGSIIVCFILFFWASYWSQFLFKTEQYDYLFVILALTMPFTAVYNLCLAIINGKSNYKKATIVTFSTYTIVTIVIIFTVSFYKISGVLLAITFTPIAQLLTLLFFARNSLLLFTNLKIRFYAFYKNALFAFIIMSCAAVFFSNIVDLQLRNYLINHLSVEEAGYWTSMSGLSNYYLSFMTGVYSLYILPKYAKMNSLKVFLIELKRIYKLILPLFGFMFIILYCFREHLIRLLFSEEFLPMGDLFKWQLLGDIVKIIAVVIAYQFIAQKLWKLFIVTEVISYILLYVLGVYFVEKMGVEGIVFAHFLRYLIYLIIVLLLVSKIFKKHKSIDESTD
ncbi:O-antigen translocase [Flavivirga rizhaonensis]|uniref:O-antigen translocase n=1 Tax=Flavivirga rizhaonensis TaxID=2559571 RepID=A0A4S1DX97_9FLAO|nr:O-antigen translocase [Flavivirga rizhaonensis]TGV02563.1 O-antigen translocase [Flavivirga rizhaonensis]